MFCAIALGALWRPLGVVHFLVCATRVLQWASKKLQKQFKTTGLGRFGGIFFGALDRSARHLLACVNECGMARRPGGAKNWDLVPKAITVAIFCPRPGGLRE